MSNPLPSLKLWYMPGACSLAVHITLRVSKLPFTLTNAGFDTQRASFPESFRAINSKMRVPVLVMSSDEGRTEETVTESTAILTAVSLLAPERNLAGSTLMERVRVAEWLNWLSGDVHGQAFGALRRPRRFVDDAALYPLVQQKGRKRFEEGFQRIEDILTGEHAVGDRFSVVDAFLLVLWRWGNGADIEMERYTKFTKLVRKVADMEETQKALEVEGITLTK